MTEHTVKAYEHELRELMDAVVDSGELAQERIREAVAALTNGDQVLAEQVLAGDEQVHEFQHRIEAQAVEMIAKRQPLAKDLREIVAALRISIDLERIGGFARNIGRRVGALGEYSHPRHLLKRVEHMASLALLQIRDVLESYALRDADKAVSVLDGDDEIDAQYTSLFRELLTYMMEDPRNITFSIHVLSCAKNIERVGDHAANIAKSVHVMVTGEPLDEIRRTSRLP